MAEELKQTKIPRFESGSTTAVVTRIPKASGFVRPAVPTKLIKPQYTGIAVKNRPESNPEVDQCLLESNSNSNSNPNSNPHPRKTFLRRFGAANKAQIKGLPRLLNKNPLKPSQLSVSNEVTSPTGGVRIINETIELSKDAVAMNVTKPVIDSKPMDATMDRALTRSNTFVCDEVDDTQVKLLSITHNVNAAPLPNDTMNQTTNYLLCKERTFKRSLSPIPGETMNSAKRKLMQVSSSGEKVVSAPMLNSTPRRSISYSDARKTNLTFFGAKSVDLSEPHADQMQTFAFDSATFEQSSSNSFAPDAAKLGSAVVSSTMNSNRMFDLTQTVEQNDAFYPENRNITSTLDTNAAEHERKNGDATKPNGTAAMVASAVGFNGNDGDANQTKTLAVEKTQPIQIIGSGTLNEDLLVAKKRFSLGLELPECTLDCSIELCDSSAATSMQDSSPLVNYNTHSYDMDESLGILTPDQMIEFLDTNATNMKLELPTSLPIKISPHKCHRIDQTPSPEELPLDPIEVKTISESKLDDPDVTLQPSSVCDVDVPSQTDSYSKTDQMIKSSTSKATTNSFITSVTSIASLDNGYHADGEASRPASRGAESPMRRVHNARQNKIQANDANAPVIRRQDPMTDSDFFTESDADDIFHRGDRRVQIIDGHMYNAQGADVFIDEAPTNEMESSGVYTDVEHRDDAPSNRPNENESDMSPDGSTDTIKSSEYANHNNNNNEKSKKSMPKSDLDNTKQTQKQKQWSALPTQSTQSIAAMSNSSSATINDSVATCLGGSGGGGGGNGSGSGSSRDGGDHHAQLVISDASSNNNEKNSCKLHSIGSGSRTDNDNSISISKGNCKAATPQFKTSTSTPKVKRFSPNRKQCKSDASSVHSKRNETAKLRDSKNSVRNRSSASGSNRKSSSPSSSIASVAVSKSPIDNGRNNVEHSVNMTSDQSPTTVHVRKNLPNKWDAVMNKIALNKAEVKTVKYSEVKSKVTCGLKQRTSPNSKSLTSEASIASDSGNSSLTSTKSSASPVTRQSSSSAHGVSKRSIERDSSKDSHLSSGRESAVATPGKQSKSTTPNSRSSARKRSSIQNGFSSNDIKIEATAKTDSTTAKPVTLHKRFTANNNSPTTNGSSSPVSEKRTTIAASKKSSPASKLKSQTVIVPVASKTSHAKEHGLPSALAHPATVNNNNSSINNNNHSSKSGTNSTKLPTNEDHHQQQQQQPLIASIHRNGKSSTTPISNKAVAVPQINTKSTKKSSLTNGELNENLIVFSIIDSTDGETPGHFASHGRSPNQTSPIPDKVARTSGKQPQQLQLQKQTAAPATDLNVIHANKTIVGLSILIQHLTTDLKAFETPSLRAALETAKDNLLESQRNLETMRTKCNCLEEQIIAKENFFTKHELALKESNERELEKIKLSLRETEKSAQEQIKALQYELAEINQRNVDALKSCQMKADRRCSELETQLQLSRDRELELVERLNNFTVTENQLRDKVQASEQEFSERLIAATARERELNEKLAQLQRQVKAGDDKRIELEDKLRMAYDETHILRLRRSSGEQQCMPNGNANGNARCSTPTQNQSFNSSSVMLEEEVLSLRTVLDMKLNEISELRKQNQSMVQSAQDELPKAQLKISILESRLEDLTIQLKTKNGEEQELSSRNRSLQEMLNQEVKNRSRLALHNEELQWKLKQNSEKYTTTLNELSKSYQDPSLLSDFKNSLYAPISETNHESSQDTLQVNQSSSSPPSSPVVKGVVEKCDSVSYVLELNDDESAESVASRVVKRAGSFRANFKERSPSFKRQLSLNAHALSQSASATSLLRQHSDSPVKGGSAKIPKNSRTRSVSLSVSNEPKKVHRSTGEAMPSDYSKWQSSLKTMSTSSPYTARPHRKMDHLNGLLEIDSGDTNGGTRSSSVSADDVDIDLAKDYMPCDARAGRSDLCVALLPASNTVEKLNKRQQIKESAGEAMVAQQSEDDQSFGSDMDSRSSTSSSSSSAASPSHSDASKHRHLLALDEEALMHKIVASLSTRSTPMEVSWSEDGDNEPYAQESSA